MGLFSKKKKEVIDPVERDQQMQKILAEIQDLIGDDDSELGLRTKIDTLILQKNYEEVIQISTYALEKYPENSQFWYYRGRTLGDIGMLQEGLNDLTKCVELNENNADAIVEMGYIYQKAGDDVNAKRCYDIAKNIDPRIKTPNEEGYFIK